MRKWWILGIGVLLVAAAGVAYFKWDKKEVVVAAPVATAQVVKGTIEVNVSGTGSIAPAEKETVKSGKQGIIGEVKVKQGDKVKKGDVLATLEGEDNTDKIKTEEVNLEKKLLQLESTQDQYKMETDDKNISSLKLSMKQQQLDIDQSRETIADLKDAVAEETIVAPVSGTVTTLSVADGDTLNGSTELMEIADYDHYEIIVGIDELDISKVKVGQSAKVTVEALADQTFTGKVSEIANEGTANNGVASFDVTVALDTAAGLKSGMSAEASIQVEKKENTLMLPIDAVQSLGGRYMVILPASAQAAGAQGAAGGRGGAAEGGRYSGGKAGSGTGGTAGGQAGTGTSGAAGGQAGTGESGATGGQDGAGASGAAGGQAGEGASGGQGGAGASGAAGGQAGAGESGAAGGQAGEGASGGQAGGYGGQFRGAGGGQAGRGQAAAGRNGQNGAASRLGGTPQMIEVGIHNEDYIEVLSGLTEGERVVLPTVITPSTGANQQQAAIGALGGLGGLGGGGGATRFGAGGGGGFQGGGQRSAGASAARGGGAG